MNITAIRTFVLRMSVVTICCAALLATPMHAQGRGMSPEQRVDAIDKAVSLTADQKTKVTTITGETARKRLRISSSSFGVVATSTGRRVESAH